MANFNLYAQIRIFLAICFLSLQAITLPLRFFLSIFFLSIQASILPHFMIHAEYRSATSFRIMFAIGLCECYQMVVMGICPYSKYIDFYAGWVENIMGAFNESTLDTLFVLNLFLAINRFCVMFKLNVLNHFNSQESAEEKWLYNFLYTMTGLILGLITVLFLSPNCGLYLDAEYTIWSYNLNLTWTESVRGVEIWGYMGFPTACFLIYCAIVILMKVNSSSLIAGNQAVTQQRSHEFRILLQSLIQFLVFIIPVVYGFSGWKVANTPLDNYGVTSVCTIFYGGLNPILYLLLLPKLRSQVLASFRILKKKQPATALNTVNVLPIKTINISQVRAK